MESSSGGTNKFSFFLNTKGLCFLCLEENQNGSVDIDRKENEDCEESDNISSRATPRICSFQALCRYLEISFRKVFDTSVPLQLYGLLEKSELLVSLCESCSKAVDQFTELYEEFEVIQMRLTSCVKTIREKAMQGENSISIQEEYKKRMRAANPQEMVQTEIIENLRQETVRKCLLRIQKELPRVKLEKMEGTQYSSKHYVISSASAYVNEEVLSNDSDSNAQVSRLDSVENMMDCTSDDLNDSISSPPNTGEQSETDSEAEAQHKKELSSKIRSVRGPGGRKLYQCHACEKYYHNSRNLEKHKKKHLEVSQHKCKFCPYTFREPCILRSHTISHHYEESFMGLKDSDLPKELFKAAVDILLHRGQKVYQLPENDHRKNKKRYMCSYCGSTYSFRPTLRSHLIQVHYNTLRTKLLELQKSPNLVVLQKHADQLAQSSKQKELSVEELESITEKNIGGLKDAGVCPYLLGGKRKNTRSKQPVETPTTTCPKCELTLPTRAAWIQHTRLECRENDYAKMGPKPKWKTSNSIWKIPKNPLTCSKCKKRFRDFDTMKKHQEIQHPPTECDENLTNDFPCAHCIKKFRFFFSYRIHLLSIHRLQVFFGYAPPGTKQKEVSDAITETLKKFAKLCDGNHVCGVCKKEFKSVSEVENHVVVVHFDETVEKFKVVLGVPEEESESAELQNIPNSADSTTSPTEEETNVSCSDTTVKEEMVVQEMDMYPEVKIEELDDSDTKPDMSDPLFILP